MPAPAHLRPIRQSDGVIGTITQGPFRLTLILEGIPASYNRNSALLSGGQALLELLHGQAPSSLPPATGKISATRASTLPPKE